jgi:predicted lipoprotein
LQAYLAAVVADIRFHAVNVADQWNGGYLGTFKGNLGTDVGSSTSLIVNELNRDLEIIKTASIGIPLGKQTFDAPLPGKSEGYFSGLSQTLMKAGLAALSAIYEGQAPGAAEGYGLHEALAAVEADYHGGDLGDAIRQQFSAALSALDAVPEPFSAAVVSSRPSVEAAYLEIQKLVVLLKTDMASTLSILITYTDADGD